MEANLWSIEKTRLQDVISTSSTLGTQSLLDIQGNLTAIANNLNSANAPLNDAMARQDVTYNIITNEAARLQAKKSNVDNAYASTQRMVQLNSNYQKRYWDYTKIIIAWTGVLALYFIMNLLVKSFSFIPSILTDILVIIAVIAAAIYSFMIYSNLKNYDLMYYGQINPAPPSISDNQAIKNAIDLSNADAVSSVSVTNNANELKCLQNGLFYNTVSATGITTCYSNPGTGATLDTTYVGNILTLGTSPTPVTLQGFQNIQADGEYEFNQYSTV